MEYSLRDLLLNCLLEAFNIPVLALNNLMRRPRSRPPRPNVPTVQKKRTNATSQLAYQQELKCVNMCFADILAGAPLRSHVDINANLPMAFGYSSDLASDLQLISKLKTVWDFNVRACNGLIMKIYARLYNEPTDLAPRYLAEPNVNTRCAYFDALEVVLTMGFKPDAQCICNMIFYNVSSYIQIHSSHSTVFNANAGFHAFSDRNDLQLSIFRMITEVYLDIKPVFALYEAIMAELLVAYTGFLLHTTKAVPLEMFWCNHADSLCARLYDQYQFRDIRGFRHVGIRHDPLVSYFINKLHQSLSVDTARDQYTILVGLHHSICF